MGFPIKDEMIDLYNKMSNDDKVFMLELMRKDIFVSVEVHYKGKKMGYSMEVNSEYPAWINGIDVQLNLEEPIKIEDADI
jgi:hypothetical protein